MTFEQKHGRPKPPSITGEGRIGYEALYQVFAVYRGGSGRWLVDNPAGNPLKAFPTHAEAIQYAHEIAGRKP